MDLVEITIPYLAVITVSLDRSITCIQDFHVTWQLNEQNSFKQLDYTNLNGASLLATGYESVFSVWDF